MAQNGREIALDTLLALERGEDYSHRLVKAVLDKYDYLDSREKAFIKRLVEGTLERRLELDYYLDAYSRTPVGKMRPLIRCLMRMSVYQLLYMDSVPDSAVCDEACKLAAKRGFRDLKGFVNGVLRTVSKNKDRLPLPDEKENPELFLSVRYSMPQWIVELWRDEYGLGVTTGILKELLKIHPVSLRFSTLLSEGEREALCGRIRRMGAELAQSPYLPYIYLLKEADNLSVLPGFAEGLCTVQDAGSALAVEAAGIRRGDFVVDVCAAPGGKSILAAEKAGAGRVLARDVSEDKLALTEENVRRMGMGNIELKLFDGTQRDEALEGRADVVLLDVPCSGLGVAGKKRDIKYHVTKEQLGSLEDLQRRIVKASAGYVRPGGTLLYSTCTIHGGENEEMVRFITRELGFEPVSLEGALPGAVLAAGTRLREDMRKAGAGPAAELNSQERAACIQLLPGYMEADGFFIAKFRRKEDAAGK